MNIERIQAIAKEVNALRNKQAKLEKALDELDAQIEAKNAEVRAIVLAGEVSVDEEASA